MSRERMRERMLEQWESAKLLGAVFMLAVFLPYCIAILPLPLSLLTYGVAIGGILVVAAVLGWRRAAVYTAVSAAVGTAIIVYEGLHPAPRIYMVTLTALALAAFHIAFNLLVEAAEPRK
ncbi:MAG: hypothetical protein QW517_09740 [Thermofilaceae archaeon]